MWEHSVSQMPSAPQVTITEEGRSGSVVYTGEGGRISGWWEFGGGEVTAIVNMGSAVQWQHAYPWAAAQRGVILRFIAGEVIRQKASGCSAAVDEDSGWIEIRR